MCRLRSEEPSAKLGLSEPRRVHLSAVRRNSQKSRSPSESSPKLLVGRLDVRAAGGHVALRRKRHREQLLGMSPAREARYDDCRGLAALPAPEICSAVVCSRRSGGVAARGYQRRGAGGDLVGCDGGGAPGSISDRQGRAASGRECWRRARRGGARARLCADFVGRRRDACQGCRPCG